MSQPKPEAPAAVELDGPDLPAFCPNPRMPIWNHHPRVYLDVAHEGGARCPYCGTQYRLKAGAVVKGHH
ncbi:MAG: zinc-finger domain-containing protein [Betaproteobacteria bacterium]|nr:zinc-finger domain-containing protein [Betaproteobacteria bacterium]